MFLLGMALGGLVALSPLGLALGLIIYWWKGGKWAGVDPTSSASCASEDEQA